MKRTNENVVPINNTQEDTFNNFNIKPNSKRTKFSEPLTYTKDETRDMTERAAHFDSNDSTESDDQDQQDDTNSTTSSKVSSIVNSNNNYNNNSINDNNNDNNNTNNNNINMDMDSKPITGSEEWIKLRRLTHNEVERRRRITINERINELATLVGTKEKRKGLILRDAIGYINGINDHYRQVQEKWTLDKLVATETIKQLQNQIDDFKSRYRKGRELNRELCAKVGEEFHESEDDDNDDDINDVKA